MQDFGKDILLIAVVVSLIAHLGTMVLVRQSVMTHGVGSKIERRVRREPMRIVRETPSPAPVTEIESVRDEQAAKDAPEAAAPLPETADPLGAAGPVVPTASALPEVSTPIEPKDGVSFDVKPTGTEPRNVSRLMPMTVIEAPKRVGAEPGIALPRPMPIEMTAPELAPAKVPVNDATLFRETVAERREELVRESEKKQKFEPVQEVTEKVDVALVEREKEAVRDLVGGAGATDLSGFASVRLSAATVGAWTYFKTSFMPQAKLPVVSKDVVVLLDASGSIGRDRIRSVREAAKQILREAMNSGDRFNLVAFRDRYEYASRRWLPCDRRSFDLADAWLDNLTSHGRTDVFATIRSVLTLPRDPMRPLIALVVTDGDANSGVSETADILSKFTALNDGLVSVYIYGVRTNGNKELIDVLTRGNRGESLIYDGWLKWNTGSKLSSLTERFRDPVLSDLRLVFAVGTKADAYPRRLRNLYRGDTLDVVGRVPADTREVSFSLRGLNGKEPYEGFFKLPLASAPSDPDLVRQWEEERTIDAKLGGH